MVHMNAFETLADDTRLQIVQLLRRGELPVNDIVGRLQIHQSGVSRHLRILLEAGFVGVRPDGQRRLYSLRPEPFRELDLWLAGYRELWHERLDRFGKALEQKQRKRSQESHKRKEKDSC